MATSLQSLPTREALGSPKEIRRAERTLHKDIRRMIRENRRRRRRNEKGAGGVRLPDEFAALRRAKLDVSRMAAEVVREQFGDRAARMFTFRAFLRQKAWYYTPDWAAQFFRGSGGRSSQTRYDEGAQAGASNGVPHPSRRSPVNDHNLRALSQAWATAVEGQGPKRIAHTAVGVATLMTASQDLQNWYRNEPRLMNRTRDLFSWAEQRRAEAWSASGQGQHYPPSPQHSTQLYHGPLKMTPKQPARPPTASYDSSRVAAWARAVSPGAPASVGGDSGPSRIHRAKLKKRQGPAL